MGFNDPETARQLMANPHLMHEKMMALVGPKDSTGILLDRMIRAGIDGNDAELARVQEELCRLDSSLCGTGEGSMLKAMEAGRINAEDSLRQLGCPESVFKQVRQESACQPHAVGGACSACGQQNLGLRNAEGKRVTKGASACPCKGALYCNKRCQRLHWHVNGDSACPPSHALLCHRAQY